MQLAPQPVNELQNAAGFGFEDGFHDQLPAAIEDGDHNRFLVHAHSDIFDLVTHLSCLLGGKVIRANVYLSPKVKCHFPAILPRPCCSFPPRTHRSPSAAAAERSPCTAERRRRHIQLQPFEVGRSFIMHWYHPGRKLPKQPKPLRRPPEVDQLCPVGLEDSGSVSIDKLS